jgi:hypothetical protein
MFQGDMFQGDMFQGDMIHGTMVKQLESKTFMIVKLETPCAPRAIQTHTMLLERQVFDTFHHSNVLVAHKVLRVSHRRLTNAMGFCSCVSLLSFLVYSSLILSATVLLLLSASRDYFLSLASQVGCCR